MAKRTIIEGTLADIENQEKIKKKGTVITESEVISKEDFENKNSRPIAGFFISYSADSFGNFWNLYEGRNLIGKSKENDISITDDSISNSHAILNIRRSRNDNRLMVAITDQNSTNGTFVNNEDIEFTTKELNDRDVIQMGNYDLLLIVVDKIKYGLSTKENLKSKSEVNQEKEIGLTSPYDFPVHPKKDRKGTKFE